MYYNSLWYRHSLYSTVCRSQPAYFTAEIFSVPLLGPNISLHAILSNTFSLQYILSPMRHNRTVHLYKKYTIITIELRSSHCYTEGNANRSELMCSKIFPNLIRYSLSHHYKSYTGNSKKLKSFVETGRFL